MENKKVPQLRFKGFEDEWEQESFSNLTYISARKNKENLPLESYSITNESGFVPQDEQFENGGTMKDADKSMYWIVPPKSFGYNPARINVGSIGYYAGEKEVIVSSLYEIFKLTENCSDDFFWHWFKSEKLQKLVERLQEGGVRLYFYYDKLCMGEIKIPSLSEQQKIGTMLSRIDSLIQAKAQKLESLKSVKKSLLQKCFPKDGEKVPEIRFEGFSGDWEEKKLGEVCCLYGRIGFRGYTEKDLVDEKNGAITLSPSNISEGLMTYNKCTYISWFKYYESPEIQIENGDILFVKTGSTFGKTALVTNLPKQATINPQFVVIKNIKINNVFLSYLMGHDNFQNKVNASVVGGAIPTMSQEIIKNFKIQVPLTHDEQQKIGQFFSKYDSLISLQQKEIDNLKTIKKSLLQKMFI